MQDEFILNLKSTFSSHSFIETYSLGHNLYVKEVRVLGESNRKITVTKLSEIEPTERHFKISNPNAAKIYHICIDGDFIPYGQAKYDYNSTQHKDGRPDSLVFSQNTLIFLELKVEQEDATFGKTDDVRWTTFFKGLTQIEDFVRFLRSNSFEVKDYFNRVEAVICMRFEPRLVSNTRRNTELLKRANAIGFRILPPHNHADNFVI